LQNDIDLKRYKNILNFSNFLINQHYVSSNVAEIIVFAKIRVNEILIDNRLIIYILKTTKYNIKKQVISIFIQKVFQYIKSIKYSLLEDLLYYKIEQIKSTASIISEIQKILWYYLFDACDFTTIHERAITTYEQIIFQLIIQYVYENQRNLSAFLYRFTKQRVFNNLLVTFIEYQKDFVIDFYTAISQLDISNYW